MPPDERAIAGVADSKQLSAAERERLATLILARAVSVALGAASVGEITRLNIHHATVLAMRRALRRLGAEPQAVLIDGRHLPSLGIAHRAVVGGDDRCYSIACASIVAKVARDRLMSRLGRRHPAYGWSENAGYGTPRHCDALVRQGLTRHHRIAFCETVLRRNDGRWQMQMADSR
jgi:ribonuclease HII